ncbi:MAG: putative purine-nucleoside phosphorylase, partial [Actinomyces urogenitalis DORA_12]
MSPKPTGVTAGAHPGTWDEDPTAASILLATGRPRHDLLVVAEPALLAELDAAWGRLAARVRLSFLPGVSAPQVPGQEDLLTSHDRGGLGVLVARGRTCL